MTTDYPKRPAFFAQKAIRLMTKVCLAQEIGQDAIWLLTVIVCQEDAKRYSGPVTFWNEQLMPLCGFGQWKRLDRARAAAVQAGWLSYEPSPTKRSPGLYWLTIPEELAGMPDDSIDETDIMSQTIYRRGYEAGYERGYKAGYDTVHEVGDEVGESSYPSPSPKPIPTRAGDSEAIKDSSGSGSLSLQKQVIARYPWHDGRVTDSRRIGHILSSVHQSDWPDAFAAVEHYADFIERTDTRPRSLANFFKDGYWRDFIAPVSTVTTKNSLATIPIHEATLLQRHRRRLMRNGHPEARGWTDDHLREFLELGSGGSKFNLGS